MRVVSIETPTHGRVLVKDASAAGSPIRLLVGFHGYAQSAEDMLAELELIPGIETWTLVSVQGLHRFYARGQRVVSSWMTREDRERAIEDNIAYVNRALASLGTGSGETPVVFVGFSQGVAMAYRAAVHAPYRVSGVVAIGGDVPPDVKLMPTTSFPAVLVAGGQSDEWYTPTKLEADEAFLRSINVKHEVLRYSGTHEWTPEVRERIHRFLAEVG